ncbi:MAG: ATPase domain-containing protein, partial [archaeon]
VIKSKKNSKNTKLPSKKSLKKVVKKIEKKVKQESRGFFSEIGNLFHSDSSDKKVVKKIEKKAIPKKIIKKETKVKNIKPEKKIVIKLVSKSITKKEVAEERFVKTGVKGFDALFNEGMGIPRGAAVLVEGGPGSGKTIFCLATMNELCKKGKKGLYMSFEESEEQLTSHMEELGWKGRDFVKKGLLRITRFDAIDVSRSIEALLSAAKKELLIEVEPMFFPDDFKPDFVVIDSLTSIASAFTGEESRFRIYMEQLFRYLEKNKITNFLIREVSSPSHVGTTFTEQGEAVSFLSDGIIVLYNVIYDNGERASAVEILKMRGVSFKRRIVEMKITDKKGIEINPNKILKKTGKNNFSLT